MCDKANIKDELGEWPADGLESMPNCPVCAAKSRKLLHANLTDQTFFCAPGKWNMYVCNSCSSAYLDPRPSSDTIALAYHHYYTHNEAPLFSSLNIFEKVRRRIANGYRNHRYGTQDFPASILGLPVAGAFPNGRAIIDAGMRHLPKESYGKRLLDIGCGNGEFLLRAHSAGWSVVGTDFDSKAVDAARSQNLDVRLGGVEKLQASCAEFDVITLAHVIEHMHDPLDALKACYRLLKPGGFLWIETPNIVSEGHQLFGANWRGLEPPRHLVLFTLESMCSTLNKLNFTEVVLQPYRPLCYRLFNASQAIAEGIDPYSDFSPTVSSDILKDAEKKSIHNPVSREFITVKAWKK